MVLSKEMTTTTTFIEAAFLVSVLSDSQEGIHNGRVFRNISCVLSQLQEIENIKQCKNTNDVISLLPKTNVS